MTGPSGQDRPVSCRCRDLSVALETNRGSRPILADVSFDIHDGEFVSIMGRSGTGKTTLLRILGGLLAPSPPSQVMFRGAQVEDPPRGVAMVFQDYASTLLPWRTIERNVALGLEGKIPQAEVKQRVAEALGMVGLAERATDYPWRLSGGMQQRVQLARALATRPSMLLMDEPFGALDAMTKMALEDELLEVHAQTGATIAFVTHDIDEAAYLSDRILILRGDPASVVEEIPVDCPRPRDQLATRESREFLRVRHAVYDAIVAADA